MNRISRTREDQTRRAAATRELRNIRTIYERVGPRRERSFRWPPHFHPDLEVMSAPVGVTGDVWIGGTRYRIRGNDFLAIPPMSIHSFDLAMTGKAQAIIVQFDTKHLVRELQKTSQSSAQNIMESIGNVSADHHESADMLHGMIAQLSMDAPVRDPGAGPAENIKAGANDLALVHRIIAHLLSSGTSASPIVFDDTIRGVVEYISHNFLKELYIDDIARHCGLSRPTLFRRFKKHCGMTVVDFINFLRIQHAQWLMEHQGKNVSEACYGSGHESLAHFSRLFKRFVGITPKKWSMSNRMQT
jgi:AraC-like DNA-binding protein